jgi:hypothetical protein
VTPQQGFLFHFLPEASDAEEFFFLQVTILRGHEGLWEIGRLSPNLAEWFSCQLSEDEI